MSNILLQVYDEGLKCYNSWTITEEEKHLPDLIFGKFLEQLEPKINGLKSVLCRQNTNESVDDFVNSCKWLTQKDSLLETNNRNR